LMLGDNGLRDDGAHSARPNEPQNGGDKMDDEHNQIAHAQMLAAPKPREFSQIGIRQAQECLCQFSGLVCPVGVVNSKLCVFPNIRLEIKPDVFAA
jgi:hypothetical protein